MEKELVALLVQTKLTMSQGISIEKLSHHKNKTKELIAELQKMPQEKLEQIDIHKMKEIMENLTN